MIDLHCHLCFGCDDGPKDAAEARDLARALVDVGVTKVACTPHIRSDKGWMNTLSTQDALHHDVAQMLGEADIDLEVTRGAEHYLDATLFEGAFAGRVVPYADTQTLLVELPYQGAPVGWFERLFDLQRAGYTVVLAHTERYAYVVDDDEMLERVANAGYLIQVNLGSLAGGYARAHKKAAQKLIKKGYAALCCGDTHRAKDVDRYIKKGRKVLEKMVGAEKAHSLLVDKPAKILQGAAPHMVWP